MKQTLLSLLIFLALAFPSAAVDPAGLTPLTTPASGDILIIHDVSDSTQSAGGSTKGITWSNLFKSPTLVTPALGVATATSVNGLTLTTSTGTLTIADGKTLTASATLTLTGSDGSTLNIGTGGTLGTAAFTAATAYQPADADLDAFALKTAPAGVVVGTTDTQALTNKTLTAPVLGGTITGTYTLGGTPTFPGSVTLDTDWDSAAKINAATTDDDFLTLTAAAVAYQTSDADLTALAALGGTNTIYYRSAANTWTAVTVGSGLSFAGGTISATGGAGTGSVNTVKEDGVQLGGSDIVTLDFLGADFDLSESPDTEANITISAAIARDAEVAAAYQPLSANLTTFATVTPGTGVATALAVNVGSAGAFVTFNGAAGTPSSITLTNATGLPVSGITASTGTALGVGSVELGHASDTTIARSSAGVVTIEGVAVTTATNTQTLTNKTLTSPTISDANLTGTTAVSTVNAAAFQIGGVAVTSSAAELNLLDGATLSLAELNYVDGVTSAIQSQIDTKQATLTNSAGLRGALSDESGTGAAVFAGGDIAAGTATTAAAADNDTSIATTAFVERRVAGTQTAVHATPSTANPLAPTWDGAMHTVWYGATGEIDLPDASGYTGRGILVYNTGAFTVTIDPNGSQVIVRDGTVQTGGVTMTLSTGAGNFVALISDGARWITLGYKGTLAAGS